VQMTPRIVPGWPKLAWVAICVSGTDTIYVYHGPCVEASHDWCVEAVWTGPFEEGDFDRTELVFGTGIRCRGQHVTFVSSGTILDRLWYRGQEGTWFISNSLPALMAVADLSLLEDHSYYDDWQTVWGAETCLRRFPTQEGEVYVAWFNNLLYDGNDLREVVKPDTAPHFGTYEDYFAFLVDTAKRLGANLSSPARAHRVTPLASVSSGYDSPAVAAIARHAGCHQAATITDAASLWRGSDSGKAIAERLGLSCQCYKRVLGEYPHEETVWAAAGRSGLLNWTEFDYPEPLCLFFTACYGDTLWERGKMDLSKPLVFSIMIDLGFGEFRLAKGVFNCVAPFWGMRRAHEIWRISLSEEMASWTLGTDYDRPIPRRILEEAGIPRGTFAVRKKNTSHMDVFQWPYSRGAAESFAAYLIRQGVHVPSPALVRLLRHVTRLDQLVSQNLLAKVRLDFRLRYKMRFKANSLLFQWANSELKAMYQEGLKPLRNAV